MSMLQHFTVTAVVLVGGCGRLSFEPITDDGQRAWDAATLDAAPACNLAAPFGTPVKIAELCDDVAHDGTFRLLPDELAGYFYSDVTGDMTIYRASRPDLHSLFNMTPVLGVQSPQYDLDATVSDDDLLMVFRSRRTGDESLFFAIRSSADDPFDVPVPIVELNSAAAELQPFLSPGDGYLYFTSTRDGGDEDIFRSARTGTTFAVPTKVSEIDAPSDDGDPVISRDGLDIYWRSTRAGGLGGRDVWTAHRATAAAAFGTASLVSNVNSTVDDGPSWLSPDGCRLYLTSARDGSRDIFVAARP